jgi:hypothetical protein
MESKKMNGTSHLLLRDGTYYFQKRVPDGLFRFLSEARSSGLALTSSEFVSYFQGKRHVRLSLKTKDKREAARRCHEESFRFDNHASKLEQWIANSGRATYDDVSPETLKAIAHTWLSRLLQGDEERRLEGLTFDDLEELEVGLDEDIDTYREALISGKGATQQAGRFADSLLDEFQIRLDKQGTGYALLCRELVKA